MRRGFVQYPMFFEGRPRPNLLYVPSRLRQPSPLLLALHGGAGHPAAMARMTRFDKIAEAEGFLVAYPAGCGPKPRRLNWNSGGPQLRGWPERHDIDDVGFLRAFIRQLSGDFPIDPDQIYATGMSKGGMMAYRLACELPDLIAAIAVVGATMLSECPAPPDKVAVMHIHGASDKNVPLEGGRGRFTFSGAAWPPVQPGIEYWRRVNDCGDEEEAYDAGAGVHHFHSEASNGSADVDFYVVDQCGHAWPGSRPRLWQRFLGIPVNTGFDASRQIWEFFRGKRKTLVRARPSSPPA